MSPDAGARVVRVSADGEERDPILSDDGARESSEDEGELNGSEISAENWAEAFALEESPEDLERPSTAFEAASWIAVNAAAAPRTGAIAAADCEGGTVTATATATDWAALGTIAGAKGITEGAAKLGDNDGARGADVRNDDGWRDSG